MTPRLTERRDFARAPHRASAVLATGHGDVPAEVVDVSVGGLGLRLTGTIFQGEFVRVRVQLPTKDGLTWFDPDAVVSRVQQGARAAAVGLRFVDPPSVLQRALAARVSAYLNGPTTPTTRSRPRPPSRPVVPGPAALAPRPPARPATSPVDTRSTKRRELAELYRSALDSVADDDKKKRKKQR